MTTRTWNGSSGNFTDSGSWTPNGTPTSGDTAIINSGSVNATGAISGVAFQVNQGSGSSAATTLGLTNATLDASSTLLVTNNQPSVSSTAPVIAVAGTSTLAGTETFTGTKTSFAIANGATLVNSGTMNFIASSPVTLGGGTLQNDGTIAIVNPNNATQVPVFGDAITGNGNISLGPNAKLEIDGSVASGQSIIMAGGTSGKETLQIGSPSAFGATISGFSSSDLIAVVNTPYTNATYTSTGANSGVLQLFSNGTLEGSLNFSGQYSLANFALTFNDFGGGLSNLQISTNANNYQSGNLPPGYSASPPMYRFFDTVYGTHFFTTSAPERDQILSTRPDLHEETNNFGAGTSGDPSSELVYRFFDTNNGTHFFTASNAEYQNVLATRPDLTYEPGGDFYEHASQQTGDVAVYRLFDSIHGTQFLTGSNSEYAGLTTQGSSAYRADLIPQGVAFYAPAGTFV